MADRTTLLRTHRKARDRAIALVIAGAVLLLPPVAGIFLVDGRVGGLPTPVVYIFVVWIALIAGAFALSRPLLDGDALPDAGDGRDD